MSPVPDPSLGAAVGGVADARAVDDLDRQLGPRPSGDRRSATALAGSVLARVGERLLDEPVGGAADQRRDAAGVDIDAAGDVHSGAAGLGHQLGDVDERRLGRRNRAGVGAVVAQDADHLAQLLLRGASAHPDHAAARAISSGVATG